jgi:tetraacyldisaccharide 4'-kinase
MLAALKKYSYGLMLSILAPWSWLYGLIIYIRNLLYDYGYKKSYTFHTTTIISIGNLAMGGTGKTPCIEYLLQLLQAHFDTAVVSRGYQRTTTTPRIATPVDNAWTLGDEPYQIYQKFAVQGQHIHIAVGANRVNAIHQLLATYPKTEVILLDDGFQHRRVHRDLNILLTTFQQPFFADHLLPMGRLREYRQAAQRANVILVTKCPDEPTMDTRSYFQEHMMRYTGRKVPIFFTSITYGSPVSLGTTQPFTGDESLILLTGIADTAPLVQYVSKHYAIIQHLSFPDHHWFTKHDMQRIRATFHQAPYKKRCILTTEKDSVRLMHPALAPIMKDVPIFVLPMWMSFAGKQEEKEFSQLIFEYIYRES